MNDLKFALRQLLKNPGFTAIAVLTLALGIGGNTAIFSLVNFVLLHPLPYEEAGQLARVYESRPRAGLHKGPISPPNFNDWRAQTTAFEGLSAFNDANFNLTGNGDPERLEATRVSANLFSLFRVNPVLGRTFSTEEEHGGKVVILSYRLWQKRFGGEVNILGKAITLDKESYSVVGVMPREFGFPDKPDLWAPLRFAESEETGRGSRFLRVVGRLKPGVDIRQAQSDMHAIAERLGRQFSDNEGWNIELVPMHEDIVGNVRPALLLLFAGVGFVLLILTLQLSLPESKYPQGHQQSAFIDQVVQRIQNLPGVRHAAAAPTLPLTGGLNSYGFSVDGRPAQPGDNLSAEHDSVTSDYFRTLGTRLLQGRFFSDRDSAGSPPVIIINQTAAKRFFPNENPLGKRVTIAGPEPGEIVGIVADVKQYALTSESPPHMYSPQTQKPSSYMTLFIRTSVDPISLAAPLRQAVFSVDKDQPVSGIRTFRGRRLIVRATPIHDVVVGPFRRSGSPVGGHRYLRRDGCHRGSALSLLARLHLLRPTPSWRAGFAEPRGSPRWNNSGVTAGGWIAKGKPWNPRNY